MRISDTIQLNRTILAWTTEISHCPLQECHKSQQTSPIWEERQNSGNDVTRFPSTRSTYGHFDLRIVVINTITIWLHWPLFLGIPQKLRPILPPVTLKNGLSIQTSGSVVCWVKTRWHIMPLSRWCIFSNHGHPVCNKDVKSGPFIFHITQHRGTVWPKVAVAQSKVKFIPELDINSSCENCSNQLHPRDSHLLQWSNTWLAKSEGTIHLTKLVCEAQVRYASVTKLTRISEMMKLHRKQHSKILWNITSRDHKIIQTGQSLQPLLPSGADIIWNTIIPAQLQTAQILNNHLSIQSNWGCHSKGVVHWGNNGKNTSSCSRLFRDVHMKTKHVWLHCPQDTQGPFRWKFLTTQIHLLHVFRSLWCWNGVQDMSTVADPLRQPESTLLSQLAKLFSKDNTFLNTRNRLQAVVYIKATFHSHQHLRTEVLCIIRRCFSQCILCDCRRTWGTKNMCMHPTLNHILAHITLRPPQKPQKISLGNRDSDLVEHTF